MCLSTPPFVGCTGSAVVCELPIEVASPVGEHKLQGLGLQCLQHTASVVTECGSRVPGLQYLWCRSLVAYRVWLQGAWALVLVVPELSRSQHAESLQTRERTRVPCIGRRIPIHCVTRKIPHVPFTNDNF